MSLNVRKGTRAAKPYENKFFRQFQAGIKKLFEKEGYDGILIGFPYVPEKPYFKPDCLLITKNKIVIIDFKQYDNKKIYLPEELVFNEENTLWRTMDGIIVKGGSFCNPFKQLQKHSDYLKELIGNDGPNTIACTVCFQGHVDIMRDVPKKYGGWFFVTDRTQFIDCIRDAIEVENREVHFDPEEIASHFDSSPYTEHYTVDFDSMEEVSKASEELTKANKKLENANLRIENLEKEILDAEREKRETAKLKVQLSQEKEEAEKAKEAAEKAKAEFDEKDHSLQLATQRAIEATEKAKKAEKEAEKAKTRENIARIEADKQKEQFKEKKKTRILIGVIILGIIIAAFGAIMMVKNHTDDENSKKQAALEEDYRNGRQCIPVEKVAEYVGNKNVCVDYYVGHVNSNEYYIYLSKESRGIFQIIIPTKSKLISKKDAEEKYLYKHLEVRGNIEEYNNSYEIKVTDLDQITIKE